MVFVLSPGSHTLYGLNIEKKEKDHITKSFKKRQKTDEKGTKELCMQVSPAWQCSFTVPSQHPYAHLSRPTHLNNCEALTIHN